MNIVRTYNNIYHKADIHSDWCRGVRMYALELVEDLEQFCDEMHIDKMNNNITLPQAIRLIMKGAKDWKEYSEGGNALIYNEDIAERLCTPAEFEECNGGNKNPNKHEDWIQCQARALNQASQLIMKYAEV